MIIHGTHDRGMETLIASWNADSYRNYRSYEQCTLKTSQRKRWKAFWKYFFFTYNDFEKLQSNVMTFLVPLISKDKFGFKTYRYWMALLEFFSGVARYFKLHYNNADNVRCIYCYTRSTMKLKLALILQIWAPSWPDRIFLADVAL